MIITFLRNEKMKHNYDPTIESEASNLDNYDPKDVRSIFGD